MVSCGTPIMTKVISSIVQHRQNEISGGQRCCMFGERNMTREKHKTKLNISEELAQGEKDDMLRGPAYLFQNGR